MPEVPRHHETGSSVPDDVQVARKKNWQLGALLDMRPGIRRAIEDAMGKAAWEEMLRGDPEAYKGMTAIAFATDIKKHPSKFLERLERQTEVSIVASESEQEGALRDVREFLAATGFGALLPRLVTGISIESHEAKEGRAAGGHEKSTGAVILSAKPEYRFLLPSALIHETGHGLNDVLAGLERGQEWFERYAADAMLRPETASSYAESFVRSDEAIWKMKSGRAGETFIRESFAEDFQRYFLDPDAVPLERRRIFDEVFDALFPQVDREEIRLKTRLFLRDKYHVAPNDAMHPRDCETTEKIASARIEEARKRALEYAERQAAKTQT